MKKVLYSLVALSLAACGDKPIERPANLLASNDFESLEGWTGYSVGSLTKEKAHSGQFSVKIDPAIEFSAGFSNDLGKISASKINKIKVQAWVYLPDGKADAVLVTQIANPAEAVDKPLLWDGIALTKEVKSYNKWVEVEKTLDVPAAATYTSKLSLYLWRAGSTQPVYMDDVSISKVE